MKYIYLYIYLKYISKKMYLKMKYIYLYIYLKYISKN